jgi:hypothetical protein
MPKPWDGTFDTENGLILAHVGPLITYSLPQYILSLHQTRRTKEIKDISYNTLDKIAGYFSIPNQSFSTSLNLFMATDSVCPGKNFGYLWILE